MKSAEALGGPVRPGEEVRGRKRLQEALRESEEKFRVVEDDGSDLDPGADWKEKKVSAAGSPRRVQGGREGFEGVRALVAEDHEIGREIVVELLRQAGVEAEVALNGGEAVEKARTRDYDIVLMDIRMPEKDGFAATREIRGMEGKTADRLPILSMTAHALEGDREKSLEAGMNDHLAKPVDRDALRAALRRWLPREKRVPVASCASDFAEEEASLPAPLPGLDMEAGLKRLGGNRRLYLELLGKFVADYGEWPRWLGEELRAGRKEDAGRRAHSIKGIAGSLGAGELERAAATLEKVVGRGEGPADSSLEEALREFVEAHGKAMSAAGSVLALRPEAQPGKPKGAAGDPAELGPLLEGLKRGLENEEPLPCKKIMEELLEKQWPAECEEALEKLKRLVLRYRLGEALAFLEKEFDGIAGEREGRDDA